MAEEKDAFYVVRKGDVVGIYKSFSDIRPSLASFDPYSSGGRAFNVSSSSRNLHGAIQFDTRLSCNLHFDGASKGNPGPAGAGAILRDGSKASYLYEDLHAVLTILVTFYLTEYNSEADAQANLAINLRG
ncbi:hypothetical protein JHK85_052822 [Glycine max]|nr:hypothetical protein JHK85_052822 [Glycine max]